MNLPMVIISMLLFFVLFFGIGFLLNMLLRKTWIMSFFYPLIVLLIIDKIGILDYFVDPSNSFQQLGNAIVSIKAVDIVILATGFAGTIIAGIVIKGLRNRGYQMF